MKIEKVRLLIMVSDSAELVDHSLKNSRQSLILTENNHQVSTGFKKIDLRQSELDKLMERSSIFVDDKQD